jgi:hypothetical protein
MVGAIVGDVRRLSAQMRAKPQVRRHVSRPKSKGWGDWSWATFETIHDEEDEFYQGYYWELRTPERRHVVGRKDGKSGHNFLDHAAFGRLLKQIKKHKQREENGIGLSQWLDEKQEQYDRNKRAQEMEAD